LFHLSAMPIIINTRYEIWGVQINIVVIWVMTLCSFVGDTHCFKMSSFSLVYAEDRDKFHQNVLNTYETKLWHNSKVHDMILQHTDKLTHVFWKCFALVVRGPNIVIKWVAFFFHICDVQVSKTELFMFFKSPRTECQLEPWPFHCSGTIRHFHTTQYGVLKVPLHKKNI